MKKLMAKLRTKSFWVMLSGALALILSRFGYTDASVLAESIVEGVASLLLLCGIVVSPAAPQSDKQVEEEKDDASHSSDDGENEN